MPWLLWMGAIGFGVLGVAGTRGYIAQSLESERERLASTHEVVATVVAIDPLPAGTQVNAKVMAVREMPAEFLPSSAIPAADFNAYVGKRLVVPMSSGQPLLRTSVSGAAESFSGQVRPGIRAMTIRVDEVNSVSGMLAPADRIDLLFSTRPPAHNGISREITAPLMQNLQVLATGQRIHGNHGADHSPMFTTITVAVTPEQGQKLVLAQQSGRLTALLRNPEDQRATDNQAMDVYQLLGLSAPGVVAAPVDNGPQVIVGGLGRIERFEARTLSGWTKPVQSQPLGTVADD